MVLLRNDGLLPLRTAWSRRGCRSRRAVQPRIQGGGSSQTTPTAVDTPFDELVRLAPEVEFDYAAGYDEDGNDRPDLQAEAVGLARDADAALLFIALPMSKESEGVTVETSI